jgi:ABC-type multidrug transport system fused ATPase/permease subunit
VAGLALVLTLARSRGARRRGRRRLVSFLATVAFLFSPRGRWAGWAPGGAGRRQRRAVFEVIDRAPGPLAGRGPGAPPMERRLALERVGFAYAADRPVLDGMDLEVGRGQVVAWWARAARAMSTAALLAMRFADPRAGR